MCKYCESHEDMLICPYCLNITKRGIEVFGSKSRALEFVNALNMDELHSRQGYEIAFKDALTNSYNIRKSVILKKNGLRDEKNNLVHKCDYVLLKGFVNKDEEYIKCLERVFEEKGIQYCPHCGEKIYPFNKEFSSEEILEYIGGEV